MDSQKIQQILGDTVCHDVTDAVERAFVASRQSRNSEGQQALQELLIMLLAATISPQKDEQAAARCILILREAVSSAVGVISSPRN